MALGGGRQGVYGNSQTRDSTQGMVKIWEAIRQNTAINQSVRTVCPGKGSSGSQGVRTSKEDGAGRSCRPAGPQLHADKANGVFYPTEVAHRVFPPPTIGFFFL